MLFITFCKSSPLASFQPFPVKQGVLPLPPREMIKTRAYKCLQVAVSMVIHGILVSGCTLYNVSVKVKVVAHHIGGRHLLGHVFIYKSRSNHPHPTPTPTHHSEVARSLLIALKRLNKFPVSEGGNSDYHQAG